MSGKQGTGGADRPERTDARPPDTRRGGDDAPRAAAEEGESLLPAGNASPDPSHDPEKPARTSAT